jgi:hypothetical protein
MKMPRGVWVVLFCTALAGCGVANRIQAREQAKELASKSDAAAAECNTQFPTNEAKTIVARTRCFNDAMAIRMPLFGTDQDLAVAFMTYRLATAERMQTGKISLAEGNAAIAEKWSQSVSESQRRRNSTLSVVAQQSAAAAQQSAADAANTAAWASLQPRAPVTCIRAGNMTTCN